MKLKRFKDKLNYMKPFWLLLFLLYVLPSFIEWKSDDLIKQLDEATFKISLKTGQNSNTTLEDEMEPAGLIIIFSCNTCPFVVGNDKFLGWEQQYNSLFKKAKEQNMGLILVNSNEAKRELEDSLEEMKKRAKSKKYKMPYLLDENSVLANSLKAKTTPHVFVLNPSRQVIYQGSIDNTWDGSRIEDKNYLADVIGQIAAKKEITTIATEPRACSIKRKK